MNINRDRTADAARTAQRRRGGRFHMPGPPSDFRQSKPASTPTPPPRRPNSATPGGADEHLQWQHQATKTPFQVNDSLGSQLTPDPTPAAAPRTCSNVRQSTPPPFDASSFGFEGMHVCLQAQIIGRRCHFARGFSLEIDSMRPLPLTRSHDRIPVRCRFSKDLFSSRATQRSSTREWAIGPAFAAPSYTTTCRVLTFYYSDLAYMPTRLFTRPCGC